MNDLNKPIRPISREESDRLKVQRIEPYKHPDDFQPQALQDKKDNKKIKNIISINVLLFFKKVFRKFIPEKEGVQGLLAPDNVLEDIRTILKLLIIIRDEDPANNPKFALKFSTAWHNLLNHYLHHTKTEIPTLINLHKVNVFLQSVHHFPHNEEHNLAFYLQKYSEETWFPVPFFKLISRLHDDYFINKENSELHLWITLLQQILAEVKLNQ